MHTSLSKKLLAGLLSLVMVLSLVAPSMSTQAASKYTLTDKKTVKADVTYKYQLKGVSKTQYVKVTRNVSGEKVVFNKKAVVKTTKIKGTGKALNFFVTYSDKEENYEGKLTFKVYNKNNKVAKTLVEKVTVKTNKEEEKAAELVDLKATGAKKLTATLSKEATVAAADVVVKKGTVTLTPADVKTEGKEIVITLGSRISEGTYSVTYKEKTLEVKTEDEKVVEFKTVGTALAWTANADLTTATGLDPDASTVNAEIEYQALNQYGEAMTADITNVTSTFGGKANYTEPTAKKNGVITVVNINAALGIVGTAGKVIIIGKTGVSSSNDVTFSEEAKLAKVEMTGIYCKSGRSFIEFIPAQKNVNDYVLVIKAYDQYGNVIPQAKYASKMYQNVSVAQVLTNVKVANVSGGALTASSFETVTIKDVDEQALKLDLSAGTKTAAGTFQLIIVGDRFGSVLNTTVAVKQIALIKSFSMTATDTVYNNYENVLEFNAVDTEGKEVKDYDTLKKLVRFAHPSNFWFEKNTNGTAKLICKPSETFNTTNDNKRETTVISETVTCNDTISAQDTLVAPKTITVSENKMPASIVKYTGDVAVSSGSTITLAKAKFVVEDQYGNVMSSADDNYNTMTVDYIYDGGAAQTNQSLSAGLTFTVNTTPKKLYIRVKGDGTFTEAKADVVLSLVKVSTSKAANITAEWWGDGDQLHVTANQKESGINTSMFKLTGYVDGKKVTIPATQYSIKGDTYTVITNAEAETAVKKATATFTVVLADVDGKEYTEEVKCDYEYSAAPAKVWAIYNYTQLTAGHPAFYAYNEASGSSISAANLTSWLFLVVDQYGNPYAAPISYEISLGKNTDNVTVTGDNTASAAIDLSTATVTGSAIITVKATLRDGKTSEQKMAITLI